MKDYNIYFKTVEGNEGNKCKYPTRLDTYGCGCQHDCSYCYAKSLLDFRELWNPKHPCIADIVKIRRQLRRIKQSSFGEINPVRLGGMTDCFQPIESLHRVTYKTILMLNKMRIPYLIVTKSNLVADDLYVKSMDKDLAHIQITVTTTNDELSKTYEKATVPSKRIDAIEKLYDAGFDVQLRLSPFIPQYIDFEKLSQVRCDKILVEFLRVNSWIKKWFNLDYSEYTLNQGGYQHMPLEKKIHYISMIRGFKEMSVCEDEDTAYLFWKKHLNHNPEDCCNLRRCNNL